MMSLHSCAPHGRLERRSGACGTRSWSDLARLCRPEPSRFRGLEMYRVGVFADLVDEKVFALEVLGAAFVDRPLVGDT